MPDREQEASSALGHHCRGQEEQRLADLQAELDRRFETAQRELQIAIDSAAAGRRGERELTEARLESVVARLDGMDKATDVLQETVTRVPTDVQLQVGNLNAVMEEKFASIDTQFAERDIRSEREARDNKVAVDAAFAAQKDSATQTDAANAKAIEKSEAATTKTIDTLGAVITSSNKALSDKIDDLKSRVQAMESIKQGATDSRALVYGILVLILTVAIVVSPHIK